MDELEELYNLFESNNLTGGASIENFRNANDNQKEQLFSLLKSNGIDGGIDYNTFNSAWTKKKNTNGTSKDTNLVSKETTENGSQATQENKGQLVKDIDAGKLDERIQTLQSENDTAKQQDISFINDLVERKKSSISLTEEDIIEIESEVENESKGDFGFFGNLGNSFRTTEKGFLNIPNPFYDPKKAGNNKKEIEIRKRLAKEKNVNPEDVDPSIVKDIVSKERKEELIKEKQESKTEDFIQNLTEEEKNRFNNHLGIKTAELSVKSQSKLLSIEEKGNAIKEIDSQLKDIQENHNSDTKYPEEYYQRNRELQEQRNSIASDINEDFNAFSDTTEDLLTTEEELDLFKRNYDKWDNFVGKMGIAGEELVLNMQYLLNKVDSIDPFVSQESFERDEEKIIERKRELQNEKEGLRKSKSVSSLSSVEDTVEWALDLVAEQTPNTIMLAATGGTGGLTLIGATSTGGKLYDLEEEERQGLSEYTDLEKWSSAFITGTAEALSEKISFGQISKAKRVFKSIGKKELKNNALSYFKTQFPDYIKDVIQEGGSEAISQFTENVTDKYLLGKDISITQGLNDAFVSGAFMSGVVYKSPGIAKGLLNVVTPKDANQKIGENFNKILKINDEITKDLSPKTLESLKVKKEKLLTENKTILDETISKVDGLSKKEKGQLLAIENETFKLRKEAEAINSDNLDEKTKELLIKDIKNNIENLSNKKESILNPVENAKSKENTKEDTKQAVEDVTLETENKPEKGLEDEKQKKGNNSTDEDIRPSINPSEQQGKDTDLQATSNIESSGTEVEGSKIAKDAKSLYKIHREVFGTDKAKSYASAVVSDKIIETIAKREGVDKSEIYKNLEFKKGDKSTFDELSKNDESLFQIVGKKADLKPENKDNLKIATELEQLGKTAKEIWIATGWERGKDNKWRTEIDDSKMKLDDDFTRMRGYPLGEAIEYKELFDLYPEIKDVKVSVIPRLGNMLGAYIPNKNLIMLNGERSKSEMRSTLLHEIQHIIQGKEGFATGGTAKMATNYLDKKIKAISLSKTLPKGLVKIAKKLNKSMFSGVDIDSTKQEFMVELDKAKKKLGEEQYTIYRSIAGEVESRNVQSRMNMTSNEKKQSPLSETEDVSREDQIVLFQGAKGAMLAKDGKFIVYALTDPNVSTPLHEMAHVYEHYLNDTEKKNILDWAGHKEWSRETSEKFAQGFEKYLTEGKSTNSNLNKIFERFKEWLSDIYNGLKDLDIELSPKMTSIYDDMIGNNKSIIKKQSFAKNAIKSDNLNEKTKEKLEKLGIDYDVENQKVAQNNGDKIIKELGIDEAYNLAKEGIIRGGARTWVQSRMFENINEKILDALGKNDLKLVEKLTDEQARIMKEFSNEKTLTGQETSMLNHIYKHSNIKYNLDFAKQEWEKKFGDKMPSSVEAKLKRKEENIKDLENKIKSLEDKIGTLQEQQSFNNIKEVVDRYKNQPSESSLKKAANALRKAKFTKSINDLTKLQSNPASVITGLFDGAIEIIATALDAGSSIEQSVKKGINHIKKSDWYKNLSPENKIKAQDISKKDFNTFIDKHINIPDIDIEQGAIKIPSKLLYDLVSNGIDNITDLTNEIKKVLEGKYPDLTHREVRDAITGYGKQVNESKDVIKTKINSLKIDGKQLSSLEDLASGKRPKRTGYKKTKYTSEQRNRIKQIRQLLKDIPSDNIKDKDRFYKTALEVYKSRLKNRINDLQDALNKDSRIIKEKRNTPLDEEAKSLIEQREELQKEYDDYFGKTPKSNETLINEIINRKEKSLRDLEVKLEYAKTNKKELTKPKKRSVSDPKIEELTKEIEQKRDELNEVLEEVGVAESKRLERAKKYNERRLNDLKNKLKVGDFSKRKPKTYLYDNQLIEIKKKLLIEKTKFDIEFEKQELKNSHWSNKLIEIIYNSFGTVKGLKATFDLSAMLRQGILLGSRNPKEFAKATKDMHKFAFNESKYANFMAEIESSEDYIYMVEDGLSITDTSGDVLKSEERFVGNLLASEIIVKGLNVNLLGKATNASERAYGGFLNSLRISVYRKLVSHYEAMGITRQEHPKKYKNLAKFVNNSTGRGSMTTDKRLAKLLNAAFFSPRMITGMIGVTKDLVRTDSTPYLRKQAATSLITFIGYQFVMKTLIAQALILMIGEDEDDINQDYNPVSSDFNKLVNNDTRYDLSAGYGIAVRTLARVLLNEKTSGKDSKVRSFDDIYGEDRFSEIGRYLKNKMSPLAAQLHKLSTKQHPTEFRGNIEDATTGDYFQALFVPLTITELVEGIEKDTPEGRLAFDTLLTIYGVGVQNYETPKKKKGKR